MKTAALSLVAIVLLSAGCSSRPAGIGWSTAKGGVFDEKIEVLEWKAQSAHPQPTRVGYREVLAAVNAAAGRPTPPGFSNGGGQVTLFKAGGEYVARVDPGLRAEGAGVQFVFRGGYQSDRTIGTFIDVDGAALGFYQESVGDEAPTGNEVTLTVRTQGGPAGVEQWVRLPFKAQASGYWTAGTIFEIRFHREKKSWDLYMVYGAWQEMLAENVPLQQADAGPLIKVRAGNRWDTILMTFAFDPKPKAPRIPPSRTRPPRYVHP